ncbi:MAG: class I SAM-dependent methyltransferase [Clostridia bacterium]|nr:class I SAM-dependent methyltransferase [Clostridia bacterium]
MWTTDSWKDYELLDASDGERLERWGEYILVRPDPQVIWRSKKTHPLWKRADATYRRSKTGGGAWLENKLPTEWEISFGSLRFRIHPTGFKHTGLFPEQAVNWEWFSSLIREANRPISVLNLFAYTGGATVAAAAAGASVCHVDAAKGMVQAAKENARLSSLADAKIRYIVDDCKKFVEREIRRGHRYDAIIMDPPSYGRGPTGEVWKIEEAIDELIGLTCEILSDKPLFFLLNSYTTGLSASAMQCLTSLHLQSRFGGESKAEEIGIPITAKGFALPCGSSVRHVF